MNKTFHMRYCGSLYLKWLLKYNWSKKWKIRKHNMDLGMCTAPNTETKTCNAIRLGEGVLGQPHKGMCQKRGTFANMDLGLCAPPNIFENLPWQPA